MANIPDIEDETLQHIMLSHHDVAIDPPNPADHTKPKQEEQLGQRKLQSIPWAIDFVVI